MCIRDRGWCVFSVDFRIFKRLLEIGANCFGFTILFRFSLQFKEPIRVSSVGTVSYTHLDVYKRQPKRAGSPESEELLDSFDSQVV